MSPGAFLKSKLAGALPRELDPILCASIGRVASTRVAQTLVRERSKAIFGFSRYVSRRFIRKPAWDLKGVRFRPGAVYKTHDFPYDLIAPPRLKIIFLYGRPSDSILSLLRCCESKGPAWMERHFAHMHADGGYRELLHRDVLRIGEQIEAWSAVRNASVLGIRYTALWDKIDVLNGFVGFRVRLPPRIERNFMDINPAIVAIVRENYRELDMKEAGLPDCFLSSQTLARAGRP